VASRKGRPRVERGWFVADDGRELACYETGEPDGPAIVFCGGLGGGFAIWAPLVQRLGSHFRLLGWDYRGLYRSTGALEEDTRIEHHASDLRALIRHAEAVNPVLIGWSMGVQVGLELHRETPEPLRGFVALHGAPGRPLSGAFDSTIPAQVAPPVLSALRQVGNGFGSFGPALVRTPGVVRAFVGLGRALGVMAPSLDRRRFGDIAEEWTRLDFTAYADLFSALDLHDATDLLPRVKTPTLVVTGGRDRFTPAHHGERMVQTLPDGEIETLPEATHFGLLEYPDAIGERIERFLRERLGLPRAIDSRADP